MIKYIDNQEVIMIKAGHWEVLMQTLIQTFMDRRSDLLTALWQHLGISLAALVIAMVIAIPLAIWVVRRPRWAEGLLQLTSVLQTIPSLGTIGIADSASRYWHGARGDCASDLRVVANLSKYLFRDLGNRRVN